MRTALAALLSAVLVAPVLAKQKPAGTLPGGGGGGPLPAVSGAASTLRVDVLAEYRGLTRHADFVVQDGSQANYVEGGEKAVEVSGAQGKGVEYKKEGFIVNVLPVTDPDDDSKVTVQLQLELSGPVKSADAPAPDLATWQLQTQVTLVKGKRTELARQAGSVAITVTDEKGE